MTKLRFADQLIEMLLEKTKAGRLRWESTADPSVFMALLPDGYDVTVSMIEDPNRVKLPTYQVRLFDNLDREIFRFDTTDNRRY